MAEKILLSSIDKGIAERYLYYYKQQMNMAQTRCWLSKSHLDEMKKLTQLNRKIDRLCTEKGLNIHEISFGAPYDEYIMCVETFDATLRQKLAVSYMKICDIAKDEYSSKVKKSFKFEFSAKSEYPRWFNKFAGVRQATEIFLNEVTEDDPKEVKEIVPMAEMFKEFLKQARTEFENTLTSFENARIKARQEREETQRKARERIEAAKREREEAQRKAREQKEAAERAKRERLAAEERRLNELRRLAADVKPVEGHDLDMQQRLCIVDDSRNTLVIAGAGSGKTTTIIGKVKYLLHTGKCTADEILMLSFTKKAADEMKQRIKAETGVDMDVSTFHKLGLDTITRVEGKKPTVYSNTVQFFAQEDMKNYLGNKYYQAELLKYCWLNPPKARSVFDFKSREEMFEYNGSTPTITIQGEYVKSVCELEIANFLFRNRVRYTYEKPYEYNTANEQYSGYKPDFYLEDYGIYIEFFAVDKNGNVPEWFEPRHGKTAREVYHDSMDWKRSLHARYKTTLVEVSYADKQDNRLLETLAEKLKAKGVTLSPMTDDELYQFTVRNSRFAFANTADIIGDIISLVKANGYTYEYFESINKLKSNESIIKLAKPIARDYEQMLKDTHQIDFNDMIYRAAKYYHFGKAAHKYKYVIVDEYQDISKARCKLLKEMREQSDFSLFCVGDDWQSIYRFAGSDVGFILNFEKDWGETVQYKIETTYRFPKEILDVSGRFVMQNPAQIKKQLRTANTDGGKVGYILDDEGNLSERLAEKLRELPQNSTVFLIGRYTDDKSMLSYKDTPFTVNYSTAESRYTVVLADRTDLHMEFLTAHKSKGLQADYVFILNNKRRGMGFPSRIHNEPVINFLLRKGDDFLFSEERRLFYVALTRAKREVWLLADENNCSTFVDELRGTQRRVFRLF